MATSWQVSSALQSVAPRPKTRPSATVALNGGKRHFSSSSTGTTSRWDMNISPALPDVPSSRAIRLPRPGADSMVSLAMPSAASQRSMYWHSSVSLPVGIKPVLTVGMRTMSCSSCTISSRISSTWSSRSFRSGICRPPVSCLVVAGLAQRRNSVTGEGFSVTRRSAARGLDHDQAAVVGPPDGINEYAGVQRHQPHVMGHRQGRQVNVG